MSQTFGKWSFNTKGPKDLNITVTKNFDKLAEYVKSSAKNLAVIFYSYLNIDKQINLTAQSSFLQLWTISKIKSFLFALWSGERYWRLCFLWPGQLYVTVGLQYMLYICNTILLLVSLLCHSCNLFKMLLLDFWQQKKERLHSLLCPLFICFPSSLKLILKSYCWFFRCSTASLIVSTRYKNYYTAIVWSAGTKSTWFRVWKGHGQGSKKPVMTVGVKQSMWRPYTFLIHPSQPNSPCKVLRHHTLLPPLLLS